MSHSPWPPIRTDEPLAVLCSGGLDSAVLLGEAVRAYPVVHPVYIRTGSAWEAVEFESLTRFVSAVGRGNLKPVVELSVPVGDLYRHHWSLSGQDVPDERSPDEAVFLPGRNVILLAKAGIWCHLNGVSKIALATLDANPFPDATEEFFAALARAVNMAMGDGLCLSVLQPYRRLQKAEVVRRGRGMPLEHTFSCIRTAARHCGRCNKCAERQRAFVEAGVADPTEYER